MLGALTLERAGEPEIRRELARRVGLSDTHVAALHTIRSPAGRAKGVLTALGASDAVGAVGLTALLPSWAVPQIHCPRPLSELMTWMQKRAPLWLRVQKGSLEAVLQELSSLPVAAEPHPTLRWAIRILDFRVNLLESSLYRDGVIEIQDLASQAVGAICAPQPGERWWDACAGGGGKSLLLAQRMDGKGTVVATDARAWKLKELRRRARRAGFSNITTRRWNGRPLRPGHATFDGVLVDAPCSGSGTWRRNPGARWNVGPDDLTALVARQERLLHGAASGVKPGGRLVYATCSLFMAENEGVVQSFLRTHRDFRREDVVHPLTGEHASGCVTLWPWEGDCDAMFVACLRRVAGDRAVGGEHTSPVHGVEKRGP